VARHPVPIQLVDVFGSALENGAITVFEHGTTTPVVLHDANVGGAVITQPAMTDRYGELEAWTDFVGLIDVVYEETDETTDARDRRRRFDTQTKTWEVGLATESPAYLEFLADSQTPYFMQAINPAINYRLSTHSVTFIAEGDKFLIPPTPANPLPALVDPFVGPGIVTDPIGYNPDDQYYTGRGAFRALKTGTLFIHWSLITEHPAGVEGSRVRMFFHGEDGTNQNYADGSNPSTTGALAPTSSDPQRVAYSGFSTLTISEFDRLDDLPYSVQFPSYANGPYPNQYSIDGGLMPVGWDIYPWFDIDNHAVDLSALTIDHLTMLIRKIA
jgi:hypothetical protein